MEQRLKHLDLWVWRYLENERNYPGLHLTARPESCAIVLDLLATLRAEGTGRKRTMNLRKLAAADEAKITGGQKYREFDKLHLMLVEPSEDIGFMSATYTGGVVDLAFTPEYIAVFEDGIRDVARGRGDYSIAPPRKRRNNKKLPAKDRVSLDLWFWPCFGHLAPVP